MYCHSEKSIPGNPIWIVIVKKRVMSSSNAYSCLHSMSGFISWVFFWRECLCWVFSACPKAHIYHRKRTKNMVSAKPSGLKLVRRFVCHGRVTVRARMWHYVQFSQEHTRYICPCVFDFTTLFLQKIDGFCIKKLVAISVIYSNLVMKLFLYKVFSECFRLHV